MNWKNLKNNRCPKCGKDWAFDLVMRGHLLRHKCGFIISKRRYAEIVTSMTNEEIAAIRDEGEDDSQ